MGRGMRNLRMKNPLGKLSGICGWLFRLLAEDLKLEEAGDDVTTDIEGGKLQKQVLGPRIEGGKHQQALALTTWCDHHEPAEEGRLEALKACTRSLRSLQVLIHLLIGKGALASAILRHQGG